MNGRDPCRDYRLARDAGNAQQLDVIMHNKYAREPEKLCAGQSASHVERAAQREKKTGIGNRPNT